MIFAKQYKAIKKVNETLITHQEKPTTRLNKYLSEAGLFSRREADRAIEVGRVKINGKLAVVGSVVHEGDIVFVDGKEVSKKKEKVYIALHKPVGIISTTDTAIRDNMITYMNYPEQIFPIGRLDKDSSGLILLTSDGDIVNKILRAEHGHEKEYVVKVDHKITNDFMENMEKGVIIYNPVTHKDQKTLPATLVYVDEYTFKIILKQGLNRQIRRMCEALGYHVVELKRIRIMNIYLNDLPEGYWRYLSEHELIKLNELIHKKS
jgi:23S rRNA pseudouridine2604 synthase